MVDVKALDGAGRLYQIEIQLLAYRHLPERIVYSWCDIISQQLQSGHDYSLIKPVFSIWLLAENRLPGEAGYAHEYTLQNRLGRSLADLGGIHLLELKKIHGGANRNRGATLAEIFQRWRTAGRCRPS